MPTFTQANREMGIKTPLGEDVLLLKSMSGTERIGRLFSYDLELLSEDGNIAFKEIVGHKVTVWVSLPGGDKRYFNGYVSRFALVGADEEDRSIYHAVVVPWLWMLSRTADCRIFQNMKVPDIIQQVFQDAGFSDVDARLSGEYRMWEYCVQYRETDFNFVSRLMEQEGIYYFFEHQDDRHMLVLGDSLSAYKQSPGYEQVPFRQETRARVGEEYISTWTLEQRVQPGKYSIRDFDPLKPKLDLTSNLGMPADHPLSEYEIYDYPGEYVTPEEGQAYVRVRMEEQQAEQEIVEARSNVRGLHPGCTFKLVDFPREDQNREYLVLAATYEMHQGSFGTGRSDGGGAAFTCSFRGTESKRPWRPARTTPKPVIQGPQTAMVVGPSGEEIYTDEHGRVKVQFHWDREGKKDENSSCWIRVSQAWAGKNWGFVMLPRIGHEVIVEFMEGDPDRPIVTGRVYNGENVPPYSLPSNMTQSGVISRSSKGGNQDNFNEIRFEDLKGSEHVYIHAEKDETIVVENDKSEEVGHDEMIKIKNDRTETVSGNEDISVKKNRTDTVDKDETRSVGKNRKRDVGKDETVSIGENRSVSVGKDESRSIAKNQTISVGETLKITVGKDESIDVAKKLVITAGDEIVIKTGSAQIQMKKDGTIVLKGKDVKVDASGKINLKASSDVTVKGSKITNN